MQSLDQAPESKLRTDASTRTSNLDVSVVMPCLNEEESVGQCVRQALDGLSHEGLEGEVVVVDNGSTDNSAQKATEAGARVILEPSKGYGRACIRGLQEANGEILVMGDCDGTYDFSNLTPFVQALHDGADLVIGNRLSGGMSPGAMPWAHRLLGTPAISYLLGLFTGVKVGDSQCGLRAIKRGAFARLDARTNGMEFASEMLLKAGRARLRVTEISIQYGVRAGDSKLSTFRDGWRHLRFLVLSSPSYAFFAPGVALTALGLFSLTLTAFFHGGLTVGSWNWQPIFAGSIFLVVGINAILLGLVSRLFRIAHTGEPEDLAIRFYRRYMGVERLLLAGLFLVALGLGIDAFIFTSWLSGFAEGTHLQTGAVAQTLVIIGANLIFGAIIAGVVDRHDDF